MYFSGKALTASNLAGESWPIFLIAVGGLALVGLGQVGTWLSRRRAGR
jgi:hypothetical protein